MAAQVIELLSDIADEAFSGRRGSREPDDDLLHALLSHQPLAVRRQALTFATELFAEFDVEKRSRILRALELLTSVCRRRHDSGRFASYSPLVPVDEVRRIAAYSANLVLLRALLGEPGHPASPSRFWANDPEGMWRSTVGLWAAGLDRAGWESMLATIKLAGGTVVTRPSSEQIGASFSDVLHARLIGDAAMEERLRYGKAIRDGALYALPEDTWDQVMVPWLISENVPLNRRASNIFLKHPPDDPEHGPVMKIIDLLGMLLKTKAYCLPEHAVRACVVWILEHCPHQPDPVVLAAAVAAHPKLLQTVPQLADPRFYPSQSASFLLRMHPWTPGGEPQELHQLTHAIDASHDHSWDEIPEELLNAMKRLIEDHRWAVGPPTTVNVITETEQTRRAKTMTFEP
jgi:hypothetical protein